MLDGNEAKLPQRYSLWLSLKKEVMDNPLRCLLAFLNTIGIFVAVFAYALETEYPEQSYVETSPMQFWDSPGQPNEGRILFNPLKGVDVVSLDGNYFVFGSVEEGSRFLVRPDLPGQPLRSLTLRFQSRPQKLVLCVNVTNKKNATAREVVIYESSTSYAARYSTNTSLCPSWSRGGGSSSSF